MLRDVKHPLSAAGWSAAVLLAAYAAAAWARLWPRETWMLLEGYGLQCAALLLLCATLNAAWSDWRKWMKDRRRVSYAVLQTAAAAWFFGRVIQMAGGAL